MSDTLKRAVIQTLLITAPFMTYSLWYLNWTAGMTFSACRVRVTETFSAGR